MLQQARGVERLADAMRTPLGLVCAAGWLLNICRALPFPAHRHRTPAPQLLLRCARASPMAMLPMLLTLSAACAGAARASLRGMSAHKTSGDGALS